jgi:glycerol kinase
VADDAAGPYVLAVDQGTSSTKAVLVNQRGGVVRRASAAVGAAYPEAGHVEQDADEIVDSVHRVIDDILGGDDVKPVAVGFSTQRESAVIWERSSGKVLGPLLGWQDRRTDAVAQRLVADDVEERVTAITGLPIDPMFSALKWQWLLDAVDPDRRRSAAGELAVGTVDTWLVSKFTGRHQIEAGNASRTQLLDLDRLAWSEELGDLFRIPASVLPEVVASDTVRTIGTEIPALAGCSLAAVLADSHAALYAHGASGSDVGDSVKVTYGTGSSVMGLAGSDASRRAPSFGLVRTLAWQCDGAVAWAVEGNILATGAVVKWLAELLGRTPEDLAVLAARARASDIVIVPAFAGLGAPWWDAHARGLIANLELGTTAADVAMAAFRSIVDQIEDVVAAVDLTTDHRVGTLLADGGPSTNDWLMQLQADVSGRAVERSTVAELSALGAARLAAETVGTWAPVATERQRFEPSSRPSRAAWHDALSRARWRSPADVEHEYRRSTPS